MRELSMAGKIAANPSEFSNRSSIHCSDFFRARLRNGWILCSANHSANLCRRSSQRKKLRQDSFSGSGASARSRSWKPSGYNSSRSTLTGRVGLKWLMMASGTSMARDQLLMSQNSTPNHLPMRTTSHGMVGTNSQEYSPSNARYNLENVFMRGTP